MKKLPSVRINIVEEDEWKPWAYDGRFGEVVADASYESFAALKVDEIAEYLSELIKPTRGPMVRKRWSVVTQEDLGRAAQAVKDGELEATRMMFQDAAQWMWEEAGTPTDRDIKKAMEVAADEIYSEHMGDAWLEFADAHGLDVTAIARKLVETASYDRKENYYDRYISLSWAGVPEAKEFLKWAVEHYGLLESQALYELSDSLKGISRDFVINTLQSLQRGLEDMDWNNRANWKKHWEASKKEHGRTVIPEILDWFEKEKAEA